MYNKTKYKNLEGANYSPSEMVKRARAEVKKAIDIKDPKSSVNHLRKAMKTLDALDQKNY